MAVYETKIEVRTKFGRYGWCGNSDRSFCGNYLLCESKHQSVYGDTTKQMICLIVHMPQNLLSQIQRIQVIDDTGFLAHYTYRKLTNPQTLIFKASKSDNPMKKLRVDYQSYLERPPNAHPLSRTPLKTIYFEEVCVQPLHVFDTDSLCPICHNKVSADPYISQCGHIFHIDCIFDYLRALGKFEGNERCDRPNGCGHGRTAEKFPCPVCRTIIESERK